jgi:DNA repair protein RadC
MNVARTGYRSLLRQIAADERLREQLKPRGSAALSDRDILVIMLNADTAGETFSDSRIVRRL